MLGNLLFTLIAFTMQVGLIALYAGPIGKRTKLYALVALVPLIWFVYAFIYVDFADLVLGLRQKDALKHTGIGMEIARFLEIGHWEAIRDHFKVGNHAFQILLGSFFHLTGAGPQGFVLLNVLMATWGTLALGDRVSRLAEGEPVPRLLYLLFLFPPTMCHWSTSVIKEALMYWSVTMVLCGYLDEVFEEGTFFGRSRALIAGAVGVMLRPHILVFWAAGIVLQLVRKRPALAILVALLAGWTVRPAVTSMLDNRPGLIDISGGGGLTAGGVLTLMENRYSHMIRDDAANINPGPFGRIPVVTGLINMFCRPFPWYVRSLRQLLASGETWFLLSFLVTGLIGMDWAGNHEVRMTVEALLLVILCFAFFFTWAPNEGLLARQRVQVLPAITSLAILLRVQRRKTIGA